MIPCQRHLFEIPTEIAYFNCAYLSPLLKSVRDAGVAGIEHKAAPWKVAARHFFDDAEELRALFARLISAATGDIAIIPAASYGVAIAAKNIPLRQGGEIVVLEEQFPSNTYQWRETASESGATLVTVRRAEHESWTDALLRHISSKTAIVSVPNVHWTDGSLIDLNLVALRCHALGATLVLDVTQSLGAFPFSVQGLNAAFVVCSAYKWLLGPYSLGMMYVNPKYQKSKPLEHNWIVRKDSENFAGLVNYKDEFQPGARRFDVGERSNFILLPMLIAALRQILEWDVVRIHQTLSRMTAELAEHAQSLGLSVPPPSQRAGHLIGLRCPDKLPDGIAEEFAARNVFVSIRGNSIRVAPHLYNSHDDLARLMATLTDTLTG